MKITKSQLRQIIKKEILKEISSPNPGAMGGHPSSNVRGSTFGGAKKRMNPRLEGPGSLIIHALITGLVELEKAASYMPTSVTPQQFADAIDKRALSRGIFPDSIEKAKEMVLRVEKADLPKFIRNLKAADPDYYEKFSPLHRPRRRRR
jgi:hypothetical protein